MKLKEFVKQFICPNSLIRLWAEIPGGHEMIQGPEVEGSTKKVGMNHEILDETGWQYIYNDCEVIGVTDIVLDDFYRESINIVIKVEKNK